MGILVKLPKPPRVERPEDPQLPPRLNPNPDKDYAAKIRAFLDRKSPYEHPLHIRRLATWSKANNYLQSRQWLRPSYNIDPSRTPHWSEYVYNPKDKDAVPMPVYNEMLPKHQNEAARLGKPEFKPYVRPSGEDPDVKAKDGAKIAEQALTDALREMDWDTRVAELGFRHMPDYGGWTIKSYWDVSYAKTTRIGVPTAMRCPCCDFRTASSELTADEYTAVNAQYPGRATATPYMADNGEQKAKYGLDTCLTCDEHDEEQEQETPALADDGAPQMGADGMPVMATMRANVKVPGPPKLEPYTPVNDELEEQDSFGRDLGQDVPLGEWRCATLPPDTVFWENCGLGNDPHGWNEIMEVHIESLDWVRERYPSKADLIKPENREALLRWHPVAGERAIFFEPSSNGAGIYQHHVRVKEFHKKPYMEMDPESGLWKLNRGRSIIMAGNVILLDGPFLIEGKQCPGRLIPRVHYDYVPWEFRSGGLEKHGMSMSEMEFDAQDNINESKSMTQDTRQRCAVPKWMYPRGMDLDYEQSGNAGSHWTYDAIPDHPEIRPLEVGNTTLSEGVARETERDLEYLERATNTREIESGSPPAGVTAGSALQLIAQEAGEQRRPRIRRIRLMFERVWSHGLELMHAFVREPRTMRVENEQGEWRDRVWSGLMIAGQTDVHIDAEPEHDTTLQQKENMVQAVSMKALDPTTSKKDRLLVNKTLGIPKELYEDDDLQYDAASREFHDYMDLGRPPVIDSDIDDDASHADQHGKDCHSEMWVRLEQMANWDEAALWLWGWEEVFPAYVQAMEANLPPALELRILALWKYLLQQTGYQGYKPRTPEELQALDKVMRFRAHLSGHKRHAEDVQRAVQSGQPVTAAPEAPATASGMVPTGGQAVDPSTMGQPQGAM